MKFFTLPALLAAALLSAVVVLPFLPAARMKSDLFAVEARLSSTVAGHLQVYFDDGTGMSESASSRVALPASPTPVVLRLPLPAGTYRALRFDPIDREGTVKLVWLRVVSGQRVVRGFMLRDLIPAQQIQTLRGPDGAVEIVATPGANDPQLTIALTPPLVLKATWRDHAAGLVPRTLGVFAGLALLLLALDFAPAGRAAFAGFCRRLAERPARAVSLVAALAVVASAYPVVFLGKSYVSPNLGTVLLYDEFPTLPGTKSTETTDVMGSDIGAVMWSHLPLSIIQQRALAQGELPLWNRYNSAGTPLLGQGQSMFGDPLHFLVVFAKGAAWAWDLKYLVAKWLFATALGLLVLALLAQDQTTKGPDDQKTFAEKSPLVPALLVSAAAPFLGFFYYRLNHPAVFSVCYAPAVLYCWIRAVQAATRRATAGWAAGLVVANLALMNSGTAKEAYMLLLCMNFSGALVLLADAAPWRTRLAKLAGLAWAGVLFVLLTAPVWATFLNTLKNSYTSYNAVSAYQIQPGMLLGAFDELFYRPLMSGERTFNPSVNFLVLLGLLYFLATLRLSFAHRAVMTLALSSLLPLALAFGLVPSAWIVQVPFLANVAHVDNTFTCALLVLWSVLAGVGFAHAAARLRTAEGRGDLAIAGLLLFALVFAWIGYRQANHRPIFGGDTIITPLPGGRPIPVSPFIWGDLAVLLVAALVFAWAARRALTRQFTPALSLILVLAVTAMLWRTGLHAAAVGFENYVARPTPRVNLHAKSEAMEFVRAAQKTEPSRGFGLNGNFFAGWTGVYGLETIHGPDALVNPYFRALMSDSGVERIWNWRVYAEPQKAGAARPFLDALNVRWYFDRGSDQGLLGRSFTLAKVADLDVYESPTAWPRAFFTDRIDVYDRVPQLVERMRAASGRPFAAVERAQLAEPALAPLSALSRDVATRRVAPATNYRLTENSTSFEVRATGPGVILLDEAYWPGDFRAFVNGRKVPILRLNHAFRGVAVDAAGDYRVVFRCVPRNFPRNLMLCGLGVLLSAGSLWLALRPARNA